MPLILGSAFLAGALLSCVLPISLLIVFATFFVKSVRRIPPNATPAQTFRPDEEPGATGTQHLTET
jgi:hypothetical protein